MAYQDYMDITPEIREALKTNTPVVALESTILSHGMPYPENVEFAAEVEKIVRAEGAIPATMALIGGRIKIGLNKEELEIMCRAENVGKVSRRDFAIYLATKKNGATTVASTMMCCAMAGIPVFATGGIGGVHRNGENTMDVSADLQELARTKVAVVCAGAKQILDIGRTLEYLETMGVPVLGNGTKDFPAFYCKKSGHSVDYAAKDEQEIAEILHTKWDLGLEGGFLIGNPIPDEYALDFDYMEGIISDAIREADEKQIRGKDLTPFLLAKIKDLTEGVSFASNKQLAYNNARCAAKIAIALSKL